MSLHSVAESGKACWGQVDRLRGDRVGIRIRLPDHGHRGSYRQIIRCAGRNFPYGGRCRIEDDPAVAIPVFYCERRIILGSDLPVQETGACTAAAGGITEHLALVCGPWAALGLGFGGLVFHAAEKSEPADNDGNDDCRDDVVFRHGVFFNDLIIGVNELLAYRYANVMLRSDSTISYKLIAESLLVPQRLYWVQAGCAAGRVVAEHDTDGSRYSDREQDGV